MSKQAVQRYMTATPVVIESGRTLAEAHDVLRAHGIRHLPVVEGGRLVGVLSQRDLYLVETLRGVDAATEKVAEAMSREPYTVAPTAPVDEVAQDMADHKYGSAVVVEDGKVVGVFTTIDALRALASIVRGGRARRAWHGPGNATSA